MPVDGLTQTREHYFFFFALLFLVSPYLRYMCFVNFTGGFFFVFRFVPSPLQVDLRNVLRRRNLIVTFIHVRARKSVKYPLTIMPVLRTPNKNCGPLPYSFTAATTLLPGGLSDIDSATWTWSIALLPPYLTCTEMDFYLNRLIGRIDVRVNFCWK